MPASNRIVLVVDDELGSRTVLKAMLEDSFTVVPFEAGSDAIDFTRSNQVHAAIVDYAMPTMSGEAVCRQLKVLDPTISLIGFTGNDGADFGVPLFSLLHKRGASPSAIIDTATKAVLESERLKAATAS